MPADFSYGFSHKIIRIAEILPGHRVRLVFDQGEERLLDMSPLLQKPIFVSLGDEGNFAKAEIGTDEDGREIGTLEWRVCEVWPDISPDYAYSLSIPI